MGHIFISYSHKDAEYAHKLAKSLEDRGFEVWIDDRIDYGSQWPHEIQDKLDSCDAFVLLVSENSYHSTWVQNEVTRAKRIGKPLFPFLLRGDPWLSIETTQYIDVKAENLPPDKFYDQLEIYAKRFDENVQREYDSYTSQWPTYTNKKYSFSFKYPLELISKTL